MIWDCSRLDSDVNRDEYILHILHKVVFENKQNFL